MELPETIKERRAQLGMTQVRLAEMLGRSASTVRSWERGAAVPPPDMLDALAAALGFEHGELGQLGDETDDAADESADDEAVELLEAAVVDQPDVAFVDHTTVMAEGVSMAMAVGAKEPETPLVDDVDIDSSLVDQEPVEPDALVPEDRDGDTDESEVIAVTPAGKAMTRLLGTALSTDVVPDLQETKAVAPLSATQVIGSSSAATSVASPFPDAQPAVTIMPAGSSEADWSQGRTYLTRRILIVAAFIGLFILLRWAMGGFAEGFTTLWDSIMSNVNL